MYQHDGTYPNTVVVPIHARGEIRRYIMGAIINRKIIEFGAQHELNIVAKRRREGRHLTGIAYYNIYTRDGVHLGRISAEYSYEQFLEKIAINAISEAERLSDLCDELDRECTELCADYVALKEATNGN